MWSNLPEFVWLMRARYKSWNNKPHFHNASRKHCVIVTHSSICLLQIADNDQRFWIRTLNFTYKDKAILPSSEMLTDTHINAAQVFTQKFPLIDGFQNPLLSQTNMFVPIACNAKGIQIHHVRNNHWITSSSTADCVEVFDSLYNNLSTDIRRFSWLPFTRTWLKKMFCKWR